MHIFFYKMVQCIVGYLPYALWDLWDWPIKTVRRYASVNMEFISIIHVYLSRRLQIFCQVYIYMFKMQNKPKKRASYVFN